MKLWIISQAHNWAYETYDSAVVAAETEEDARRCAPELGMDCWAEPQHVKAQLIGEAIEGTEAGWLLGSYNSG